MIFGLVEFVATALVHIMSAFHDIALTIPANASGPLRAVRRVAWGISIRIGVAVQALYDTPVDIVFVEREESPSEE